MQADQDLLDASRDGDLEKVKRALENGANTDAKDTNGNTPFHVASSCGHEAVVSLLHDNGADRTIISNEGLAHVNDGAQCASLIDPKNSEQIKEERVITGNSRNLFKRGEKKYVCKVINQHPSRQALVVILPPDEKDTVEETRKASVEGNTTGAKVSGEVNNKYARYTSRLPHKTIKPAGGIFSFLVDSKEVFVYLLFPKNVEDHLYYLSESNSFNVQTCNFIVEESDFDENLPTVHVTFNADGTIDIQSVLSTPKTTE
jgi:hypothetical protein